MPFISWDAGEEEINGFVVGPTSIEVADDGDDAIHPEFTGQLHQHQGGDSIHFCPEKWPKNQGWASYI